jgi:hypothetical protein
MFFIDMQLGRGDLAARMCDMRIWLDTHNVETSGFSLKGVRRDGRPPRYLSALSLESAANGAKHDAHN